MTRSFSLYLHLLVLSALLLPFFVFAQAESISPEAPVTTASVQESKNISVRDAVLLGQEKGSFSVSFTLQNLESRELSDIQYEVTLVDTESSMLQFLGTEVVTLGANETIEKVITYPIQDIPLGEYLVAIGAKITGSQHMAQVIVGTLEMTEALAVTSEDEYAEPAPEVVMESKPAAVSKMAIKYNIHFIITLLGFAITFLVLILAIGRHKKPPVNV